MAPGLGGTAGPSQDRNCILSKNASFFPERLVWGQAALKEDHWGDLLLSCNNQVLL